MEFKPNDRVVELATGKKAIVVGTKTEPYKPKINPYNKKEIYPDMNADYLIMYEIDENNYSGLNSVFTHQLIELN